MIDTQTLFSALSNDIRLRCLILIQLEGELCVCELTHALDLSQPMISRHLALLRKTGLVTDRRAGQWIYYEINSKLPEWIKNLLHTTAQANKTLSPYKDDLSVFAKMSNRSGSPRCV